MIHEILDKYKVVLASASPRRKEIFGLLGIKAIYFSADIAELLTDDAPERQAMLHATNKAMCAADKLGSDHLIVAADTVVAIHDLVLGKPADTGEARKYLNKLSGHYHHVFTGICIYHQGRLQSGYECTKVKFASLSPEEIEAYLATGEPMDKAGAYGIQGYGAQFISKVEGCYFNVMGFPIRKFYTMLREFLEGTYETAN